MYTILDRRIKCTKTMYMYKIRAHIIAVTQFRYSCYPFCVFDIDAKTIIDEQYGFTSYMSPALLRTESVGQARNFGEGLSLPKVPSGYQGHAWQ